MSRETSTCDGDDVGDVDDDAVDVGAVEDDDVAGDVEDDDVDTEGDTNVVDVEDTEEACSSIDNSIVFFNNISNSASDNTIG